MRRGALDKYIRTLITKRAKGVRLFEVLPLAVEARFVLFLFHLARASVVLQVETPKGSSVCLANGCVCDVARASFVLQGETPASSNPQRQIRHDCFK